MADDHLASAEIDAASQSLPLVRAGVLLDRRSSPRSKSQPMRYAILSAAAFFILFGGSASAVVWRTPHRDTSYGPWGNPCGYNPYYLQRQSDRNSCGSYSGYYFGPQMYIPPQMNWNLYGTPSVNNSEDGRRGLPPAVEPPVGQ